MRIRCSSCNAPLSPRLSQGALDNLRTGATMIINVPTVWECRECIGSTDSPVLSALFNLRYTLPLETKIIRWSTFEAFCKTQILEKLAKLQIYNPEDDEGAF